MTTPHAITQPINRKRVRGARLALPPQSMPQIQRSSRIWIIISLSWAVYLLLNYLFSITTDTGQMAFYVYLSGAKSLIGAQNLYGGVTGWIYLYPPLLAQTLIPLAAITRTTTATIIWFSVNSAMIISTLVLISHYIPTGKQKWIWLMPLFFVPFWQALYLGQITLIMMALLAIVWMCMQENQHLMAGVFLALSIWIKVFPALLVLYFLWRRDWHVITGILVAGLALLGLQVLISGPELILTFVEVLLTLFSGGQPEATYENLSIFGFASRLFQANQYVIPLEINETLFSFTRLSLTIGMVALSLFAVLRSRFLEKSQQLSWRFDIEYSLVIMTILLLGSTLWISGLPPLLLIYIFILRNVKNFRHPFFVKSMVALSFILITLYQPMLVIFKGEALHALTLSIGFGGVMLIWGLLVWLLITPAKQTKMAPVQMPSNGLNFATGSPSKN